MHVLLLSSSRVKTSPQTNRSQPAVRWVPVQHQVTPLILCSGAAAPSQSPADMLSLVLAPLAIFIITDQLEILVCLWFFCLFVLVLKGTGILLPSLLCISQWKQARRKTETETKPICRRQFCRGRKDQTEAANLDLLRHRCLVIPSRGQSAEATSEGIKGQNWTWNEWNILEAI